MSDGKNTEDILVKKTAIQDFELRIAVLVDENK